MATVQKQGRGYKITVSQGYDYIGKRIRQYMTWVPEPGMTDRQIKKELERQAVLFEEKVSSGTTANSSMRFADFAEKYMTEYAALYLKPKTIVTYTENLRRINQAIGHIKLSELRTGHINSFYRNLQEEGIRNRETAVCKADLRELIGIQRGAVTAFSNRAGVSRPTIKQAIDDQPINRASADAIARALGVKTAKLFMPKVTVHSLRHTYATLMIADGVPLVVISKQLGHTQTSTTANIYAHAIASAQVKAMQTFDRFNDLVGQDPATEQSSGGITKAVGS